MESKITSIYERNYDNPFNLDGTKKPNKCLGDFIITQHISEDSYNSVRIGKTGNDFYIIIESEVSGHNGGSRFEIHKLRNLQFKHEPRTIKISRN